MAALVLGVVVCIISSVVFYCYRIFLINKLISLTIYTYRESSRDKMPASSRKRNKGKDRKAKKEESKRVTLYNTWQKWACGDMGRNRISIQCNHGVDTTIPDISHPISSFITEYFHSDDILDITNTYRSIGR